MSGLLTSVLVSGSSLSTISYMDTVPLMALVTKSSGLPKGVSDGFINLTNQEIGNTVMIPVVVLLAIGFQYHTTKVLRSTFNWDAFSWSLSWAYKIPLRILQCDLRCACWSSLQQNTVNWPNIPRYCPSMLQPHWTTVSHVFPWHFVFSWDLRDFTILNNTVTYGEIWTVIISYTEMQCVPIFAK